MSDNGQRSTWNAAETLRIVLAGIQSGVEVSDPCRRAGLNPVQVDAGTKPRLGSASRVVATAKRPALPELRRAAERQRLTAVIAAITAAYLELQTGLVA